VTKKYNNQNNDGAIPGKPVIGKNIVDNQEDPDDERKPFHNGTVVIEGVTYPVADYYYMEEPPSELTLENDPYGNGLAKDDENNQVHYDIDNGLRSFTKKQLAKLGRGPPQDAETDIEDYVEDVKKGEYIWQVTKTMNSKKMTKVVVKHHEDIEDVKQRQANLAPYLHKQLLPSSKKTDRLFYALGLGTAPTSVGERRADKDRHTIKVALGLPSTWKPHKKQPALKNDDELDSDNQDYEGKEPKAKRRKI
jgi:hypothetical protein